MVRLLLVVADAERQARLASAFAADRSICVANNCTGLLALARMPSVGGIDVVVVDLCHPEAHLPELWAALHQCYLGVRFMAIVEPHPQPQALLAAMHAGAHWYASLAEPDFRVCEVAHAAYIGQYRLSSPNFYAEAAAVFSRAPLAPKLEPLALDAAQRHAVMGERAIPLPPVGFAVLEYLAHRAGAPVSAADLLTAIWHSRPTPKAHERLRATVRRLRARIEPDPRHPQYVLNIYSGGYLIPAALVRADHSPRATPP